MIVGAAVGVPVGGIVGSLLGFREGSAVGAPVGRPVGGLVMSSMPMVEMPPILSVELNSLLTVLANALVFRDDFT